MYRMWGRKLHAILWQVGGWIQTIEIENLTINWRWLNLNY